MTSDATGPRLVLRHRISRVKGALISPWKFECGFCAREYRAHSQQHALTRVFFHVKDHHPTLYRLYVQNKESK